VKVGRRPGSNLAVGSPDHRTRPEGPSLVDRCVAGEPGAWRELHASYSATVRTFLYRMGTAGGEIDDAVQEVFVQVFRSLGGFEGRADLKTWIYRLCVTHAGRVRRRRWLRNRLRRFVSASAAVSGEVQPDWSASETQRRAAAAVEALRPLHREVFVLYELEGLSGEDIARVLRCPPATVWRRLHYARQEFERAVLGGDDEERRQR
jgi:RNA polymerase sigma-70 factor (ECF subfamily)